MEYRLAKFFSAILHPLLMPLISIYCLFSISSYFSFRINEKAIFLLYAIAFLFTVILPAATSVALYKLGWLSGLESPERNERKLPYIITAIYYTTAYYLLSKLPLPSVILLSVLGASIIIIITSVINLFWKISAHMIGVGGLIGALLALSFKYLVDSGFILSLSILAAGLLGFARLQLKAHTPAQVYIGFLLGLSIQFSVIYFIANAY